MDKATENTRTFLTVASVEFNITHQTTQLKLPVEVSNILIPVVESLYKKDPELLSRILGLALLNIVNKKVLLETELKTEALKGGELYADKK